MYKISKLADNMNSQTLVIVYSVFIFIALSVDLFISMID